MRIIHRLQPIHLSVFPNMLYLVVLKKMLYLVDESPRTSILASFSHFLFPLIDMENVRSNIMDSPPT